MNKPIIIANIMAVSGVSSILGALLWYVYSVSLFFGITLTLIYGGVGFIGYRAAHIHTRGNHIEYDTWVPDEELTDVEWMARYPNG